MGEGASYERRARLRLCQGPLACETSLLRELRGLLPAEAPPTPIRPLLIVVPSRSLRRHLLARIAADTGRALAGIDCRTHYGLALEVLRRSEETLPPALDLLPVLGRRYARAEPLLGRAFEPLLDGYGALDSSLRDLLNSGLEPALVEPLCEALAEEGPEVASPGEIERATALLRVAGRVAADLERPGVGLVSPVLRRAAERVRSDARAAVDAGPLLVYGFSDATGVTTDFLTALLERFGGLVFLDRPRDPALPEEADAGVAFTRRFRERLETVARPEDRPVPAGPPAEIDMFRALGARAECREVAVRALELVEGGARPESIGVVARDLARYAAPLAGQLGQLGVPFSAIGQRGPLGPLGSRLRALAELLARGRRTRLDRWLDATGEGRFDAPLADLRLALFALGAGRLGDAADLAFEPLLRRGGYRLPIRQGLWQPPDEPGAAPRLSRRRVPAAALDELRSAARDLCQRLDDWRGARRLASHLENLLRLVEDDLGWEAQTLEKLDRALAAATRRLPTALELELDELLELLEPCFAALGDTDLGGRGGGVQVLGVIEARGRTFEHLFVVGLNRGHFPRAIREDPLLRDPLREVLARQGFGPLPDLPGKLRGYEEESYLFAQLLAASPRITLSWQQADEDNVALTPSPLLERLRWSGGGRPPSWRRPPLVAPRHSASGGAAGDALATASEHAVLAGLHGDRRHLAPVLELALARPACRPRRVSHEIAVRARLQTLDELDPRRGGHDGERARLGPFHGLIGPVPGAGDPRSRARIFITTLERLAVCPWQTFLRRLLGIEEPPDPLAALPGIEARMIGSLTHNVLEALVAEQTEASAGSLDEALLRAPVPLAWPDERTLARLLRRESTALVRKEGIGLAGFARVLARVVRPFLEIARRHDFAEPPAVLAAEVPGSVAIADLEGRSRDVHFRADRADAAAAGLRLTDYKTGRRPVSKARTDKGRRNHLLDAVRSGAHLQAVAYALAAGRPADEGRFLFLHPELESDLNREVAVRADDEELAGHFAEAVRTTLEAWDRGVFFPRLVEPSGDKEPAACGFCEVTEACLRGDSGARGRLRARSMTATGEAEGAVAAFDRLWNLGRAT